MAEQPDDEPKSASRKRPRGTGRALLWTVAATLLPGLAHLRAGHRRAGALILGVFLLLIGSLLATVYLLGGDLARGARMAVQTEWLMAISGTAFVVAVLWMTVIVHSYVVLRPHRATWTKRFLAGATVAALCLAVAAPAAEVMRSSYTAHQALTSVFEADDPSAAPHDDNDPWLGEDRISILLLGGDSGSNRYGTRTDTIMVANIDVEHGDVVLVGLPRNLENVPFPEGSELAKQYPEPYGFDLLLNDIYQFVADNPEELAIRPHARNPAADTLKETVSYAIGVDIDYYALVDMRGFEDLVDAIGGVTVRIEEPIPYGQQGDVLEAGVQHLDGNEALWYGRSRVGSDDYTRMGRQGCLLQALAEQADPWTILTSFQDLAGATERTLETDIPQSKLRHLIDAAELIPAGSMRTLQLSPPQVRPASPDWEKIRELVDSAVQEQEDIQAGNHVPSPEPSATPSQEEPRLAPDGEPEQLADGDTTEWQEWSGSPDPSPTTPGRQVGDEPVSLDAICP